MYRVASGTAFFGCALALVGLASGCGPRSAEPITSLVTIHGRVLTSGPCRVGVPNVPVYVLGQAPRAVSGADGAFELAGARPPFDLVAITPSGPVAYLNAATMKDAPGLLYLTINTDLVGPEPKALATFTAIVIEENCTKSATRALSSPTGLEALRFSLAQRSGNTFTGTVSGCETVEAVGDKVYLGTVQSLSVDSSEYCEATMDVTTPWGFGMTLPLPPVLPEVRVKIGYRGYSLSTVQVPAEGHLKVTSLTPFGSVERVVEADGGVSFLGDETVELSNVSAAGLAVASYSPSHSDMRVLDVPAIPSAVSPVEGFSALGPGTEFLWTNTIKGVRLLTIERVRAGGPKFSYFTDGTSLVLPDLSAVGATLEPQTEYKWTVYTHQGWGSSLDDHLMYSFPQRLFYGPTDETLTGARTIRTR